MIVWYLSYDVESGSEITPYNQIDDLHCLQRVYRFSGSVMMSTTKG